MEKDSVRKSNRIMNRMSFYFLFLYGFISWLFFPESKPLFYVLPIFSDLMQKKLTIGVLLPT